MKILRIVALLLATSVPFVAAGEDIEGYVPLSKAAATVMHAAAPAIDGQSGYLGAALSTRDGGLWVMEVAPDSAAQRAGLIKGDRILTLDTAAVQSMVEFRSAVQGRP